LFLAGLLAACTVTPEPLTHDQRQTRVVADLEFITAKRFVPAQPISLYDAMARAVAFNLQHSVRQIEQDIAKLELDQSNLDSYPDFAGDVGFNRDSEVVSADTDANIRSANIGVTWNLLDLGVSYARAKQTADRVLVAEERRRKGLQDIIRNVRLAYWKAVGAQRLMTRMIAIERDFSAGLAESRRLEVSSMETRRRTVGFRRGLIDTVRQLITARKEYGRARLEFAQLINIQPGVNFTLQPAAAQQGIPALPMDVTEMASFALANRPELRVEDYNERITDWESREALYGMFPGLDLNFTRNFSTDSGLLTTSWLGAGAQLGMNLFRLFSGPLRMQAAERRGELARRQRLALSVAVLAQVHIAFNEYRETNYQFRLARQISRSDRELSKMAVVERTITEGNRLDVIDVAARQLRSEVEQHRAYVELRRAHGDILHALGLDVIPDNVPLDDVDGLRVAIRHTVAKWESLSVETDPANDGTIEDLVGQVFADMRRDTVMPGEPVAGARPDPSSAVAFEMQGMIGRAAGPVAEAVRLPAAVVDLSPAGTAPTEAHPRVTAALDPADMALAMTNGAMTALTLGPALSADTADAAIAPPAPPDAGEIQITGPLSAPVMLAPSRMAPTEAKPLLTTALDPADIVLAMTNGAMAPPPLSDVDEFQITGPLAVPVMLSPSGTVPTEAKPPMTAALDPADMVLAMANGATTAPTLGAALPADTADAAIAPPAPPDVDEFQITGPLAVPVTQAPAEVAPIAQKPLVMAALDLSDLASAPTGGTTDGAGHQAIVAPPVPDLAELQSPMPPALPAIQPSGKERVTVDATARPTYPRHDQGLKNPPPLPRMKHQLPAYDVQFGAFSEPGFARNLLAQLRNLHRPVVTGRRFRVVTKIHPGRQALFHVRYGTYLGRTAAVNACDNFARQGRKCIIVRHNIAGAAKSRIAGGHSGSQSVRLADTHRAGADAPVATGNDW
jgi:outer membrane protein TolC